MFELSDLKQTKVYQEALQKGRLEGKLQGKLEAAPRLLELGLSVERVVEALGLSVEQVRQSVQNQSLE